MTDSRSRSSPVVGHQHELNSVQPSWRERFARLETRLSRKQGGLKYLRLPAITGGFLAGLLTVLPAQSNYATPYTITTFAGAAGRFGSNPMDFQAGTTVAIGGITPLYNQSALDSTGNSTDLGILGRGFFIVKLASTGERFATRDGHFRIDDNGYLITPSGLRVQGLIGSNLTTVGDIQVGRSIPSGTVLSSISFDPTGNLFEFYTDGTSEITNRIQLQNFKNPSAFTGVGQNLYSGLDRAGPVGGAILAGNNDPTFHGLGATQPGTRFTGADTIAQPGPYSWGGIGPGTSLGGLTSNFNQGALEPTGNPTDLGISGLGYFVLRDANTNQFFATRHGRFQIDGTGFLSTPTGLRVQGLAERRLSTVGDIRVGLSIPNTATLWSLSFDTVGSLIEYFSDGTSETTNRVLLLNPRDTSELTQVGENLYTKLVNTGQPNGGLGTDGSNNPRSNNLGIILPGTLEASTVNKFQKSRSADSGTLNYPTQASSPDQLVVDRMGNIFIADSSSALIRKITPSGAVSIFAGSSGHPGSLDGTGSAAQFVMPRGLAMDQASNLYVSDHHTIRKISPDAVVTTLAGSAGDEGSDDGVGSAARFCFPDHLAMDHSNNLYVADSWNHIIRKITPAGVVTTLASADNTVEVSTNAGGFSAGPIPIVGVNTSRAFQFNGPSGLAIDAAENLYVADYGNNTIHKITPAGVLTTLAGTAGMSGSTDGTGSAARFLHPRGLTVDDAGNIYVVDAGQSTIRKITPAGEVTTLAGTAGSSGTSDGVGSAARFFAPVGVATDHAGNLYVSDNLTIRKITAAAGVTTFARNVGLSPESDPNDLTALFNLPYGGAATDRAGTLYVADRDNSTIRKITPAGFVTTLAGSAGLMDSTDGTGTAARFNHPEGVATDGAGNVYITDTWNSTIRKITPDGAVSTLAGAAGVQGATDGTASAARFHRPSGLALDRAGNLYVADRGNNTIRKITSTGEVTTLAGTAGTMGSSDGTGSAARFDQPNGIAVDSVGNVYVADTWNSLIRKITPAGVVSTFAGMAGQVFDFFYDGTGGNNDYRDGLGSAARFCFPYGLTVDSSDNLYVADTSNTTIRKITPAGAVTTIAGFSQFSFASDGTGSLARFALPTGIAVDNAGTLYVVDYYTIRMGTIASVPIPVITSQPQNQTVNRGNSVAFTVVASGTPTPTYQWKKEGVVISGATNSSYTITAATSGDTGSYAVTATNISGTATSNAAVLTFLAPPSIAEITIAVQ